MRERERGGWKRWRPTEREQQVSERQTGKRGR